jgi:hypothetical protein
VAATGIWRISNISRDGEEGTALVDQPFSIENTSARLRLVSLVAGLSDEGLARQLPNGWTVAQALVHLAFWDLRQLALLKRWQRSGVNSSPVDVDVTNEAVLGVSNAIPLKEAARLAVASATAVDAEADRVSEELYAVIVASGHERVLRRSLHRNEHLRQIEEMLADGEGHR